MMLANRFAIALATLCPGGCGLRNYHTFRASMIALCATIPGCATPMGSLNAPPKWCMASAKAAEPLRAGDDLILRHADLKEANGKERSKNRCLRGYARAVAQ